MSRKTLFYIAVNAVIAELGMIAACSVAKYTPERKIRQNPIELRREYRRAVREGRMTSETVTYMKHGKPVRTVRKEFKHSK